MRSICRAYDAMMASGVIRPYHCPPSRNNPARTPTDTTNSASTKRGNVRNVTSKNPEKQPRSIDKNRAIIRFVKRLTMGIGSVLAAACLNWKTEIWCSTTETMFNSPCIDCGERRGDSLFLWLSDELWDKIGCARTDFLCAHCTINRLNGICMAAYVIAGEGEHTINEANMAISAKQGHRRLTIHPCQMLEEMGFS